MSARGRNVGRSPRNSFFGAIIAGGNHERGA
jgi:hypothetical protein